LAHLPDDDVADVRQVIEVMLIAHCLSACRSFISSFGLGSGAYQSHIRRSNWWLLKLAFRVLSPPDTADPKLPKKLASVLDFSN